MRRRIIYPLTGFIAIFLFHAIYSLWRASQISKQWVQIENISLLSVYFKGQHFFLGFSYGLAGAFTVYALLTYLQNRRSGVAGGIVGGLTLTGILFIGGCFLLGCCGSPMLVVYLSLFGSSFLGFAKPLVLIITMTSVVIGYFWIEKRAKTPISCCIGDAEHSEASAMPGREPIEKIRSELREGMSLAKCRQCGCMQETLKNLGSSLSPLQAERFSDIVKDIVLWLKEMGSIKYTCLRCDYCFPAEAMNIFNQVFPEALASQSSTCTLDVREQSWPSVPGEYFAFCDGPSCPVAVSTLASVELSERLASERPKELCIVGKTETENIGIEKLVKNTITNPTIRFLLLAGKDSTGHNSGGTLAALWENGVDEGMRVIGSRGRRPVLRNVTRKEVEAFRKQVQVENLIGCEDVKRIAEKVKELSQQVGASCSWEERTGQSKPIQLSTVSVIQAKAPPEIEMDKSGYFVIIPQPQRRIITVEHYSYDNKLQRVIEGHDAKSLYCTIIENGWITQLSHAAYLGKELAKAELFIKLGIKYVQDGA